jgi:hypothetical protein
MSESAFFYQDTRVPSSCFARVAAAVSSSLSRMSGRSRRRVSGAASSSSQQEQHDDGEDSTDAEAAPPSRRMRRGRRRDDDDEDAEGDGGPAGSDWTDLHAHTQPLPSRASAAAASAADDDIEFITEDTESAEADGHSSTAAARAGPSALLSSSSFSAVPSSHSLSSVDPAVVENLPENLRGFLAPIEASQRPGQAPLDHQSRSTRLRLLSQYSKLGEDIKVNPFLAEDNQHLQFAVYAADVLNSSVSHITEEIADAEQLSSVAGQGVKKVKKILGLQTALSVQGQTRQQRTGSDARHLLCSSNADAGGCAVCAGRLHRPASGGVQRS